MVDELTWAVAGRPAAQWGILEHEHPMRGRRGHAEVTAPCGLSDSFAFESWAVPLASSHEQLDDPVSTRAEARAKGRC